MHNHRIFAKWICIPVLALVSGVFSQTPKFPLAPVHWSAESSVLPRAQVGTRYTVILHATIDDGWHLYALQETDAFPLAMEIALQKDDPAELLRAEQGRPHRAVDPASHVVTNYFEKSALFTLRLRANATQMVRSEIHVLVRYEACNDRMCLPPKNEMVPVLFMRTR